MRSIMSQIIGILSQTFGSHCAFNYIYAQKSQEKQLQWLSMVWDKIPMIWDIIDLANYSLDWYDDLTKSDYHGNSNVADTKK